MRAILYRTMPAAQVEPGQVVSLSDSDRELAVERVARLLDGTVELVGYPPHRSSGRRKTIRVKTDDTVRVHASPAEARSSLADWGFEVGEDGRSMRWSADSQWTFDLVDVLVAPPTEPASDDGWASLGLLLFVTAVLLPTAAAWLADRGGWPRFVFALITTLGLFAALVVTELGDVDQYRDARWDGIVTRGTRGRHR